MATSPRDNQEDQGPRDWRRRRRRRQPQEQPAAPAPTPDEADGDPAENLDGGEEQVSRSLISFAEPALDAIGNLPGLFGGS